MEDTQEDFGFDLTPQQRKALEERLKPLLEAISEQWQPIARQLQASIAEQWGPAFEGMGTVLAPAFERLAQQMREMLATLDISKLLADLPANLHQHLQHVERLADFALIDGIPIGWIPRPAVLDELLEASNSAQRYAVLVRRRQDILDDCARVISEQQHGWASAVSESINAARDGFNGPAQSHAANLIDSIILKVFHDPNVQVTRAARADAAGVGEQPVRFEASVREVAEILVLRPLVLAFKKWYFGYPPPVGFNRHATAHSVGEPAVFNEHSCIIGIMLASSLARQFSGAAPETQGSEA